MMLDLGDLTYTGDPEPGEVITIPAGESRTRYGITATCPAGGPDCVITITDDGAEYTGGKPTLMAAAPAAPAGPTLADVNAAISATDAARMAVEGLSATSTDEEVADAKTKVGAAEDAVAKLADDHSLHASVEQISMDLMDFETGRTVAGELMAVNDALETAKTAVDELDRAGSTAEEVADARTKVNAAQMALNAATALSEEQRTELGGKIMDVDDTLDGIEAYRATDAGQLAVAEAAVNAAEELIDALTDESSPTEAGNAYAALQRAKQALAAAENLPDNVKKRLSDKITELENQAKGQSGITMKLAEATTAVNSLNAESTDDDVTEARKKVDAAKEAAMGLEDDDARKVAIAALDTNLMGIENQRTADANKPGLDANAMALATNIDQNEKGNERPTEGIGTLNASTGKPPLTGNNKFAASTMSIDSIDGWMGNAYTRMNKAKPIDRSTDPDTPAVPASDDTVVVYNNKGSDEEVSYVDHFAGLTTPRTVTPGTGALEVAKNEANVITDMVTLAGTGATITVAANGDVKGTFHGLSGTFSCGGTACTISRQEDGKFRLDSTDTLTFTPTLDESDDADPDATQVANLTIMIADPDYMHFGYWKNASMKKGKPVYNVDAFFGGTAASTLTTVQDRLGSAKYAGKASGLYVRKELNSSGDPQHLYHGQFTADANLTASFGGTSVAADDHYSIKGAITNFMDGDDAIDSTWSVTLRKMGFAGSGTNAGTFDTTNTNMFTGGVTEGDTGLLGSWRGQFFGETAAVADDTSTSALDESKTGEFPTGVAGMFDGHFVNGHARGAFGAEMQDE